MKRSLAVVVPVLVFALAVVWAGGPTLQTVLAQTPPAEERPAAPPPVVTVPLNAGGAYDPADTLILYGDMAIFWGGGNPENCILKNRYKRGEPVGFRMTALDPANGAFAAAAELKVNIPLGSRVEILTMRYRDSGDRPRPGFWTAKWVVPDDAPSGVIRYTVTASDQEGRTGAWAPYNLEASMLTIMD